MKLFFSFGLFIVVCRYRRILMSTPLTKDLLAVLSDVETDETVQYITFDFSELCEIIVKYLSKNISNGIFKIKVLRMFLYLNTRNILLVPSEKRFNL